MLWKSSSRRTVVGDVCAWRGVRFNFSFPKPCAAPCPGQLHPLLPSVRNLGTNFGCQYLGLTWSSPWSWHQPSESFRWTWPLVCFQEVVPIFFFASRQVCTTSIILKCNARNTCVHISRYTLKYLCWSSSNQPAKLSKIHTTCLLLENVR